MRGEGFANRVYYRIRGIFVVTPRQISLEQGVQIFRGGYEYLHQRRHDAPVLTARCRLQSLGQRAIGPAIDEMR
jgi:hypothetical protein